MRDTYESRTAAPPAPNHHGHHPGFAGVAGLAAGLTMIVGRGGVARLAADTTQVGRTDHVVDIGCGPGVAAREAAHRGASVTGIDPAPVMLALARGLTRHTATIEWTQGAAEALPLGDGSATVCWSLSTVHHWPDLEAGLAEVRRVLAPGGRFLAIERRTRPGARGHASHGWTDAQAAEFAARCRTTGFADVHVETAHSGKRTVALVRAARP